MRERHPERARRPQDLPSRSTRRGFTLIEVLVALVVTALIATVAFGAAQAGIDVHGRLQRVRREESSAAALREVLQDALRHAERGTDAADTTFALGTTSSHEILRFVTRGVLPPLGTGARWTVSLATSRDGLTLLAAPLAGDATPVRLVAPSIAGAEVQTLAAGTRAWLTTWDRVSAPPAAVSVRFLDANGRDAAPALVARTRPAGEAEEAP